MLGKYQQFALNNDLYNNENEKSFEKNPDKWVGGKTMKVTYCLKPTSHDHAIKTKVWQA